MEPMDLNVKVYKKQSPFRIVFIFALGVLVGFALFYIYSQFTTPPTKEILLQPQIAKQEPKETPKEEPSITKPTENNEQKIISELNNTAPFIYIIDEEKFSDETLGVLKQIRPVGVVIRNYQGGLNHDRLVSIIDKINSALYTEGQSLPLIAIDLNLSQISTFPPFSDLPKLTEFNTSTDTSKIIEAGTLYAQRARDLGISMFLGPMIELYVAGRVPETEKPNYIGDTTELIQWVGISFIQGIWQGNVIPVVTNFPSKSLSTKKEIDSQITYALEVDSQGGDLNQAISQLGTWLFPFSEAIHQKCPALLVSHVAIPLLDDESPNMPASISQKIIHGLIREKWAYDGLIIADDISEYPLHTGETLPNIALQMAGVGVDLICVSISDIDTLTQIRDIINQNISYEAKELRIKRLTNLIMSVSPLPKKETKSVPHPEPPATVTPAETTIIAQATEGSAQPTSTEQTATVPSQPETQEQTTTVNTEPPNIPPEQASSTTPEPTLSESPISTEPPKEEPAGEVKQEKLNQDLSQIVGETKKQEDVQKKELEKETVISSSSQKEKQEKSEDKTEPEKNIQKPKEEKPEVVQTKKQKLPQPPGTKEIRHQIARGETLFSIAQRYGVKPKDIIDWNGIDNPNLIKYGLKLVIYVPEGANISPSQTKQQIQQKSPVSPNKKKESELSPISVPEIKEGDKAISEPITGIEPIEPKTEDKTEQNDNKSTTNQIPPNTGDTFIYIVKHGDTLETIARDTRVSKEEIIQLNNLKKPYYLPAGRKLKVPRVPKVSFK